MGMCGSRRESRERWARRSAPGARVAGPCARAGGGLTRTGPSCRFQWGHLRVHRGKVLRDIARVKERKCSPRAEGSAFIFSPSPWRRKRAKGSAEAGGARGRTGDLMGAWRDALTTKERDVERTKSSISLCTLLKKENSLKSGWKHRGSSDTSRRRSRWRRSLYVAEPTSPCGAWLPATAASTAGVGRRLNVAPASSKLFPPP